MGGLTRGNVLLLSPCETKSIQQKQIFPYTGSFSPCTSWPVVTVHTVQDTRKQCPDIKPIHLGQTAWSARAAQASTARFSPTEVVTCFKGNQSQRLSAWSHGPADKGCPKAELVKETSRADSDRESVTASC